MKPEFLGGLQERQVQKVRLERRRVGGSEPEAYIAVRYPVRLHGVSPLALRSDIQHLLGDCKARLENIRCDADHQSQARPVLAPLGVKLLTLRFIKGRRLLPVAQPLLIAECGRRSTKGNG